MVRMWCFDRAPTFRGVPVRRLTRALCLAAVVATAGSLPPPEADAVLGMEALLASAEADGESVPVQPPVQPPVQRFVQAASPVAQPAWTPSHPGIPAAAGLPATPAIAGVADVAGATIPGADWAMLLSLQQQFQLVADEVAPSVVAISATFADAADPAAGDETNGEQLEHRLHAFSRTVGTGFCVDSDGYIVTNEHVVAGAERLWVTCDDGRVLTAFVVASDPRADLAVLKVPATLPALKFAPVDRLRRGTWALTLGNPVGLGTAGSLSMSVGVVSATNRSLNKLAASENRLYHNLLQTTADINPGNSGGPLFDLDGQVIGVITACVLPHGTTDGIGFAIPADAGIRSKIATLVAGAEVTYGYLGVSVSTPTPQQRRQAGLADAQGVRVESIDPASPAMSVLNVGDMVLSVNGEPVADSASFVRSIGDKPAGRGVTLDVWRDHGTRPHTFTLGRRWRAHPTVTAENQRWWWEGLQLGPTADRSGVIVLQRRAQSRPSHPSLALRPGQVIASVAGRATPDLVTLQRVLSETSAPERLVVLAPTTGPLPITPEPPSLAAADSVPMNVQVAEALEVVEVRD